MALSWKRVSGIMLFAAAFTMLGYGIHSIASGYTWAEGLPVPNLPEPYDRCEIHNLARDWQYRNHHIQAFYRAWQKKEPYAIVDQGMGIDTPLSVFWITDNGKTVRIIVDHLSFRRYSSMIYNIKEVEDFSIYSWEYQDSDGDGQFCELLKIDPETVAAYDLILRPTGFEN